MTSYMTKWIFLLIVLTTIIFLLSCFFVKKEPTREMKSKFESGIDQMEQESPPFYMHFFYIGILFLIFDVEVILCIPIIINSMTEEFWMIFWLVFMSLVFFGLILEISIDSIQWKE